MVHFRGLGLELPDGVALGWYPDTSQLAFLDYEPADANTLRARWALGGFATLGDKVLTRLGRVGRRQSPAGTQLPTNYREFR